MILSRSPPETKESTMDSPDAQQRQEWFAQYFSFWLTTEPAGFSMSTKLETFESRKKKKFNGKKETLKKEEIKNVKLFVLYCHWFVDQHIFRPSQQEIHLMFWELLLPVLSIKQVECRDVIYFKLKRYIGHPLPAVDWAETVLIPDSHQLSSVRCDLIWSIISDCFAVDEFVS